MKKSSTILFVLFLVIVLIFLVYINLYRDITPLDQLSDSTIIFISALVILLIVLLFVCREIENNKTLNQFITIITHKIKTPLTGIRWSIGMLQKDLTLLEKKDLLLEMQKTNDRLMEIIDLLVGFARFDNKLDHEPEKVSLKEIVDLSFSKNSALIKNKNIKFSVDEAPNLPPVFVDKSKIQFAVDMLVDNAIKYTPKDGGIYTAFEVNDNSVTLKISDTGIGMGFFDKKKVFRHFFRAQNAKLIDSQGLGLGLYTARKIVERNKGKLWAESEGLNKGSTFSMQFPIKK